MVACWTAGPAEGVREFITTKTENVGRHDVQLSNGLPGRGTTLTQDALTAVGGLSRGERLRWLMEFREIKQTELALKIGLTQSAISNLVTDKARKPSAPTLLKLSEALQCSPAWLLHGGDPLPLAPPFGAATASDRGRLLTIYDGLSDHNKQMLMAIADAIQRNRDSA